MSEERRDQVTAKEQYDILGIGDITCDAFIKLREAWVEADSPERAAKELCMSFGDKLPHDEVVEVWGAGNSSNAALSATRLGLKAAVLSDVGGDRVGEETIKGLSDKGLDTSMIRIHEKLPSNYHYVLRLREERTILIKHNDYPYPWPKFEEGKEPKWLYLSSMGENSLPYHDAIYDWLESRNGETKMAFQPGTFQMRIGVEAMRRAYALAEIFVCNVEEIRMILDDKTSPIKDIMNKVHDLGPKYVCITDGPDGAYASCRDCKKQYFMPIYPDPSPPKERTGCGDAFASTFTSSIVLGMSFEEALKRAPIQSMNVVQHIGAHEGLLTKDQLEEFLKNAPEGYEPQPIK